MATTLIDSVIFGDIFSTDSMRRVWSDGNRTQKYLDIESALALVQARLDIIPKEAAEEINRQPECFGIRRNGFQCSAS